MDNRLDKNKKLIINGMFPNQDNVLYLYTNNKSFNFFYL